MTNSEQQTLPNGSRIGVYEIRGAAVSSDFSIVYRGWNHHLNAKVSVEEYFPCQVAQRTADALAVEPLSNESREDFVAGLFGFIEQSESLLHIEHPNIVAIDNVLEANGTAYLVSKYTKDLPLARMCINHQTQFDEDELKVIFLPILSALQQVHERGFIHGAAIPENILLRKDGEPVLTNFSNARLALALQTDTLSDFISAGYAPPEYGGTSDEVGPWSDIYTLGATMYHCVSGRVPESARDRLAALSRNFPDPFQPLTRMPPVEYSEALCATIDSMLALKTSDRPQSAFAVLTLLEQAPEASGADTTRTLGDLPVPPVTDGGKNKRFIMGAGAVLTVAGLLALGFWFQKPEERGLDSSTTDDLSQLDAAEKQVQTAPKPRSHETDEREEQSADERLAFAKPKAQTDYPPAENAQNASPEATGAVPAHEISPPETVQESESATSDTSESASLSDAELTSDVIQKENAAAMDGSAAPAESTELSLSDETSGKAPESREGHPNQPEPMLPQYGQKENKTAALDRDADRSAAATQGASTADNRSDTSSPVVEPVEPPPSVPENGAERKPPNAVSPEAAGTQTADDAAGMIDADKSGIIAAHLAAAEEHLNAERLTTPAEGNAITHYRAILEIDPDHPDGRRGLEHILTHYGWLIEKAVDEGSFQHAWIYLTRAGSVLPGAPILEDFRTKIEDAEAVRNSN